MKPSLALLAAAVFLAACGDSQNQKPVNAPSQSDSARHDSHTLSNADEVSMKHLRLDVEVSFDSRRISGVATWDIANTGKVSELQLDDDGLRIDSVVVDGVKTAHKVSDRVEHLGSRLSIPIGEQTKQVAIYYASSDSARALQWLTPQQTMSKKHPFLYTQSESIYARSWVPCADGPGIRFTYEARVKVPKGLMALMSAENPQAANDSGIYHFRMDKPIPAYLMALAVGNLEFRAVDGRTGVYAEPAMIGKARYELEDMGKMVTTAESLYGPYQWGRYDVLVLPPGFPIGGMENPKLTFCTPTIIAGDRSLVNLIAHELAHNWSGNLVTNATWNDIWMNEGFTVYFERRITEAMTDKSYVDMLWELGYQDLEAEVASFGQTSPDTWLKLKLAGRDPDEGLSDIPYEKGSLLLWLIEQNVGREKFDAFLKEYFSSHAFKTITTEEFLKYLDENLLRGDKALKEKINVDAWVYGPGIPANAPRANGTRFATVDSTRQAFIASGDAASIAAKTTGWSTHEWLHFLRKMPDSLNAAQLAALDRQFRFTNSGNSEIADLWFILAARARYEPAYANMDKFLSTVGRQKFLEPLYSELMKSGQQELARSIYARYRQNYHPLTQAKLDRAIK